ncbi:hypothetical protein FWH30_03535, partial [Microgenomates group bacterium]|nr:hypothetical protein [Microgenomates group bacterium]
MTIRYNLDTTVGNGTSGGGSALTTVSAPATNGPFSGNITAAAGSRTVHVWVCDGTACSTAVSRTFTVDTTAPTFTLSPTPTGTSNWTTATAVTVAPADEVGGSGVAETRYSTTNNLNATCTGGGSVGTSVTLAAGANNIYVF